MEEEKKQSAMEEEKQSALEEETPLETLFQNLEGVIGRMEGEQVNLEESFRLYQKGMALLQQCNTTIDAVEKKVLLLDEEGNLQEF